MRISSEQIETIVQNHGFQVISDDQESQLQLKDSFGSHTFFLNEDGLLILEREKGQASEKDPLARLTVVASWEPGSQSRLVVHSPPVETDVVINLATGEADDRPATDDSA